MSARNGFVLLLALSTLSLFVACGGSSAPAPVAPPSGGFTTSNFSGTYVVAISGADLNQSAQSESFFAIVGTMTVDGMGNISGGTVDINDPDIGGFFPAQSLSASTYTITSDGRGKGTLATPEGNFAIDFVLTSNGHGLITRFDSGGSGSGTLDLQTTTSQSALTALTISLTGTDNQSANLVGGVGAFNLDSNGNITTGDMDYNDGGSSAGLFNLGLTGSVVLSSGNFGTAVFNTSSIFPTLAFDVWAIDSTHLKLIETDTGAVLAGDAFTQQTSIADGPSAFTMAGSDSSGVAVAVGGLATWSANAITSAIEDYNDNGTANSVPSFTGTCTTTSAVGRCNLALTGFSNGVAQSFIFAAYPSSGGVQLLEIDSLGFLQGAGYAQSASSFAASQGYGLNLSGDNGGEVDDIAEFTADSTSASPNMSPGLMDENDIGAPNPTEAFIGTYTPDSSGDGRGSILVPTLKYGIGGLGAEYYVVNSSTMLVLETDISQIAVGSFQLQSASSSPGSAQPVFSMVRPFASSKVRAKSAASRHK